MSVSPRCAGTEYEQERLYEGAWNSRNW